MKRLLSVLLVMLLLTACAKSETEDAKAQLQSQPGTDTKATFPQESALEPGHPAHASSNGAATVYDLSHWGVGSFQAVYPCEGGVAALETSGVMWVFDPETGLVTDAFSDVFALVGADNSGFATSNSDTAITTYTFCDPEPVSWTLPGEIQGKPVVDPTGGQIYYCTPGKVHALDMSTGLTRVLREHSYGEVLPQSVKGQILELLLDEKTLLISTVDGRSVFEEQEMALLGFFENKRLVTGSEDGVWQTLLMENGQVLAALDVNVADVIPTAELEGILVRSADCLLHYALPEGKLTSQISLPSQSAWIQADGDLVWILEENVLYRWDLSVKTELTGPGEITKPYYSAQSPDLEGIGQCKTRAASMGEAYGVKINIWDDVAADTAYGLEPEYRVDVINTQLDRLEKVLGIFPQDFLKLTVQNNWVHVDIVKAVEEDLVFRQFWHEGGCHVAVTLGANMEEAFYTGLGWAVDTHILGNSRDLEYWEELNPKGFAYDLDYAKAEARDDAQFLEGEERYFVDKRSMAFPTEDRARIFFHAMVEGNEDLFENIVIQKKLRLVCDGIREAYGLEAYEGILPWEQYLD